MNLLRGSGLNLLDGDLRMLQFGSHFPYLALRCRFIAA
jgi:hypothetical protein